MILDEKLLGLSDVGHLVHEECKEISLLEELKQGGNLAFASKRQYPNWFEKIKSKEKPKIETYSTRKQKSSVEEFSEFLSHMLQGGEFSKGFLMSHLSQIFEQHTGKFLDVEHLGYKNLSALVASHCHLVAVGGPGRGSIRIFASGFVGDPVPNLYPNSSTIEETSISFCEESSIKGETVAKSPGSKLMVGYNSSLVDLQRRRRSKVESSSAFFGEDFRHGIKFDFKQNEQSTSVAGHEERSLTGVVSSPESTIQIASRGWLFSLESSQCNFTNMNGNYQ